MTFAADDKQGKVRRVLMVTHRGTSRDRQPSLMCTIALIYM